MELWMHFAVGHNYIASSVSIQNINGWKIIVKSSLFRKQKKQEEEEKERKKEERLRKREQKQKEREERRNLKKVKRQQEEEQKKLQMKIAMEERRLLLAQRNLESIRLIAELLTRAKVWHKSGLNSKYTKSDGTEDIKTDCILSDWGGVPH